MSLELCGKLPISDLSIDVYVHFTQYIVKELVNALQLNPSLVCVTSTAINIAILYIQPDILIVGLTCSRTGNRI